MELLQVVVFFLGVEGRGVLVPMYICVISAFGHRFSFFLPVVEIGKSLVLESIHTLGIAWDCGSAHPVVGGIETYKRA